MSHNPRLLPVPTTDFHAGLHWRLRFDHRGVWKPSVTTITKWRGPVYKRRAVNVRTPVNSNGPTFFPRLKALVGEQFPGYTKVELTHGFDGVLTFKFTK